MRTLSRWRRKISETNDNLSDNDYHGNISSIYENRLNIDRNPESLNNSILSHDDSDDTSDTDNENNIDFQDDYYHDDDADDDECDNGVVVNQNTIGYDVLYEDSTISVDECVFRLLNFYVKNNITKAALKESLEMQLKILPKNNQMPKTVFKLFQYAKNVASPCQVIQHYYRKKCLFFIGDTKILKCCLCNSTEKNDISFFFEFDICDQIKFMFENNNIAEKLKLPRLSRNENIISDITDGSEYIRVNSRDNRSKYDLTLILNTDGLSLVKSAKSHCWPLMFVIAELPEHIRESFVIIAGLWYDNVCKPPMNVFLRPLCLKLQQCFNNGINWVNQKTGETINSKAVAPLIIADAPARAQLQNILNFNGRYGCNICEIRTKRSKKHSGQKACRIFPFKIDCKIRTGERMEAQARKLCKLNKNQIRGVKGYSILSCLPLVDIGTCVLPEYMHSVLLGVVKQVIKLWLDKKGPWNINKKSKEIDNFVTSIRPLQSFCRLPRPLTHYHFYKASENYNFLLFYSLPALIVHLPNEYFQHWMILVIALFNLLQNQITPFDLNQSDILLKLFVKQFEKLYGDRELTYNTHQLLHLALCVERWGPLWATSAFPFENYNGFIAKFVHGNKHLGQEIVNNLIIAQGVHILKNRVIERERNDNVQGNVR